MGLSRQLKDRSAPARLQTRNEYDLSVCKLKSVMVDAWDMHVDLAKDGSLLAGTFRPE